MTFQPLGKRSVTADFDGSFITSDAGGLLLREIDDKFQFVEQFSRCFTDHRQQARCEHSLVDLLKQRLFGIALGYEDLVDHDTLRFDPLLAVLVDKEDPLGHSRRNPRDRGAALAGKSTLNRLELTPVGADADGRYKKITADLGAIQKYFVEAFIAQQDDPPKRLVLDLDATDFPLHGDQLGKFYHGYYKNHCYLPLYIFCGDHPLLSLLRPSDVDGSAGSLKHVARIVSRLRRQWPGVPIVLRGDSGFCRDHLMSWCEANGVDFLFGLAKNPRLQAEIQTEAAQAKEMFAQTGKPARVFKDFTYTTLKSWSRARRVVGKAEHLAKGANPRFVVTSLGSEDYSAAELYEQEYCGRGEMENRIKEQQLHLFANRVSCGTMRANQLRMCLSTMAYILLRALRQYGLARTDLQSAQAETIRLRVLKLGARIMVSVRRVYLSLTQSYPLQSLFRTALANIQQLPSLTAWAPAPAPGCG